MKIRIRVDPLSTWQQCIVAALLVPFLYAAIVGLMVVFE